MNKALLIILDGFGEGKPYAGNAVTLAKTPTLDALKKKYPWTLLKASGHAVGIPEGTQGGSEVGHFTIGAGRVVFQSLEEINRSIEDKSFFKKPAFVEACARVNAHNDKNEKSSLHLLGMISDEGVHAHINHLFALLELAKRNKVGSVFIHAITDGRDVPERSAPQYIKQIQEKIHELGMEKVAKIATIIGRYYAMDRDFNWVRMREAYNLYTLGSGTKETDPLTAIQNSYKAGIETDYYIKPIILDENGTVKDKDSVIFWNYRTDRAREITWAFTGEHDAEVEKDHAPFVPQLAVRPYFVCMGPYSEKAPVVFHTPIVKNNLGEVISKSGLKQLRIGETQKYAHVTYFFNSQIETPLPGEDRVMLESPKCHSYAEKPEMSAREITDALLPRLDSNEYALVVLNFANCDLVGHSGELQASIKAVEIVDECLGRIIPSALKNEYVTIVTGDHGNVEHKIYEEDGSPCPSHTTNPVPFILVGEKTTQVKLEKPGPAMGGELKDIAPTILALMDIKQPSEMTGHNLMVK